MRKINYESQEYDRGWLVGYDAVVVELYKGFDGAIPKWLLSVIGGKKVVANALKPRKLTESQEYLELITNADYDCGETDGYSELLEEIEEEYSTRQIDMPTFLKKILGEAPSDSADKQTLLSEGARK